MGKMEKEVATVKKWQLGRGSSAHAAAVLAPASYPLPPGV